MKRTASAHWTGNLKKSKGDLTTQSGVLQETNYSYKTRFEEDVTGTNPEELLGAAHAGCFTMWVASVLAKKGYRPKSLDTEATVTLKDLTITQIHLAIRAVVPKITEEDFIAITEDAKKNCIISKAIAVPISSKAQLANE
ncbi:MAG: OsmC family peroxiredoxin [Bacteroidota bacterium]|nr:OsmC family peroxiredoxin [Bacteroidota bacterium]